MSADRTAIDAALKALHVAEVHVADAITAVEAVPWSTRDVELLSLAQAARMEIHAAAGCLRRLSDLERVLAQILRPEDTPESEK